MHIKDGALTYINGTLLKVIDKLDIRGNCLDRNQINVSLQIRKTLCNDKMKVEKVLKYLLNGVNNEQLKNFNIKRNSSEEKVMGEEFNILLDFLKDFFAKKIWEWTTIYFFER